MLRNLCLLVFPALLASCQGSPARTRDVEQPMLAADKQDIDPVCEGIATFFNTLNVALPMEAPFKRGVTSIGVPYPEGKIVFNSSATSLQNCIAYTSGSLGTIAQLAVKDQIKIIFPAFSFGGDSFPANITADECTVKLHYHIDLRDDVYSKTITMNAIFMEISNLGDVRLTKQTPNEENETEDITEEADDVIRPILMKVLDEFSKKALTFQFDPQEDDNDGGFEAFKLVFKRYLLNVYDQLNGGVSTEKF